MNRNALHFLTSLAYIVHLELLTSLREDKTGLYHIIIGLVIFVLVVILMETHNYYTGKYDEKDDETHICHSDMLRDITHVKSNINVIRRKNTVIIKD